jgi:antitoxin CptB
MNVNNNKNFNEHLVKFKQLKWSCRRGMLELDVLLGKFLEEVYFELSKAEQQCFLDLLHYSDPDLFTWLLGTDLPKDPELVFMIQKIRHYAQSRIQI